jgi:hypothetical protein
MPELPSFELFLGELKNVLFWISPEEKNS